MAAAVATMMVAIGVWAGSGRGARPAQMTIAVLPFDNLTGDPEHDYLADGLTEEMISTLGQVDQDHLRSIGRTSMMRFKRTRQSLTEVGRELGADSGQCEPWCSTSTCRSCCDSWAGDQARTRRDPPKENPMLVDPANVRWRPTTHVPNVRNDPRTRLQVGAQLLP
jgi:hypothetical protein